MNNVSDFYGATIAIKTVPSPEKIFQNLRSKIWDEKARNTYNTLKKSIIDFIKTNQLSYNWTIPEEGRNFKITPFSDFLNREIGYQKIRKNLIFKGFKTDLDLKKKELFISLPSKEIEEELIPSFLFEKNYLRTEQKESDISENENQISINRNQDDWERLSDGWEELPHADDIRYKHLEEIQQDVDDLTAQILRELNTKGRSAIVLGAYKDATINVVKELFSQFKIEHTQMYLTISLKMFSANLE